jgi:hypothetical protein
VIHPNQYIIIETRYFGIYLRLIMILFNFKRCDIIFSLVEIGTYLVLHVGQEHSIATCPYSVDDLVVTVVTSC